MNRRERLNSHELSPRTRTGSFPIRVKNGDNQVFDITGCVSPDATILRFWARFVALKNFDSLMTLALLLIVEVYINM